LLVFFHLYHLKKQAAIPSSKCCFSSQRLCSTGIIYFAGLQQLPPADELAGKYALQNDAGIIVLAFHVDYWNRFGAGKIFFLVQRVLYQQAKRLCHTF